MDLVAVYNIIAYIRKSMVNVFLTRKCNLNCKYCFAKEFINKKNEEFTIENFNKVLQFIKQDGIESVGLLGGEPTLHSAFRNILDILINDRQIKIIKIFTNGLELHKYKEYWKNKKFYFLINCNSKSDIGLKNFNLLKSNLLMLNKVAYNRFHLGINLYSPQMEYSYIFELLKLVNHHKLRFSISSTNYEKETINDILIEIIRFKKLLFDFYKDCLENEIAPNNDCNSIPDCLFNAEDKKILLKLVEIGIKYNQSNPITSSHSCIPSIDILPDMTTIRCLGLSKYSRINLYDFKSIENIKKYYTNTIDIYAKTSFIKKDCESCNSRIFDKCGICILYKLKKMKNIKDYAIKISI